MLYSECLIPNLACMNSKFPGSENVIAMELGNLLENTDTTFVKMQSPLMKRAALAYKMYSYMKTWIRTGITRSMEFQTIFSIRRICVERGNLGWPDGSWRQF